MEAHPDIYRRIPDYSRHAWEKLRQFPLSDNVDLKRFQLALLLQNGMVTDITRLLVTDGFEREIINLMIQ
jgi:L,D-transpeptidase ErfK/SrfK